jgi:hypothetical protein
VKAGLDAAANYLGLTQKQLVDKLQSGKSLADVAGDEKKSVDGLKSAIKDSVKKDLDADVKAGHLSQSEENDLLGRLDNKLDALVNHKGLLPPPGLRKHREFRMKPGANQNGSFPAPPDAPAPPPGAPII